MNSAGLVLKQKSRYGGKRTET